MASSDSASKPRRIGKYEVHTKLSVGGMAELFLASTKGPGGFEKLFVIKRILPDAARNEQFVQMFLDEARLTASFSHQNIVQVFDLEEDEDGLYVSMEYIHGANLNEVFNACVEQQAVLALGFSLSVVHGCAMALHYAHTFRMPNGDEYPVIHRDVAQKNIMVTFDGQVKLLDFGIAKAKGALNRTAAGTVKGTAGYMSPEQARGEALDGRSDVFSLGVVMWEMVTGQRLFAAETELQELMAIIEAPIRRPSDLEPSIPGEVSDVVLRALERDRNKRFSSAKEFGLAIQNRCGRHLYNQDQRAAFMFERFPERSRALPVPSRARRDVPAASPPPRASPSSGARASRRSAAPSKVRRKTKGIQDTPSAASAPRQSSSRPSATARIETEEDIPTVTAVPESRNESAPLRTDEAPRSRSPKFGPIIGVLVLLFGVLLTAQLLLGDQGLAVTGDPRDSEDERAQQRAPAPILIESDSGQAAAKDAYDSGSALEEPTSSASKVPSGSQSVTRRRHEKKRVTQYGTVVIGVLPGATISLAGDVIGRGKVHSFSLPVGLNELTFVGDDGVKRVLEVLVRPGENPSINLALSDIPLEKR